MKFLLSLTVSKEHFSNGLGTILLEKGNKHIKEKNQTIIQQDNTGLSDPANWFPYYFW